VTAAEGGMQARIQALGRTVACRLSSADHGVVKFVSVSGAADVFQPWEPVSVYFDFRGQGFVFESTIRKVDKTGLEVVYPENMYRGLSRRWPRVAPPQELSVDLLLPDGGLKLDCPLSREYVEVDLPASQGGLSTESLASLIDSFRVKAEGVSDENRVVMFKEGKGPSDVGEEFAAAMGRALFVPSILSGLPLADPYPEGRIITKDEVQKFEDDALISRAQRLREFFEDRSRAGLAAALWCPVRYFRYTIGVVYLASRADSKRDFDFQTLDFAWDFAGLLAWHLKRYGYYDRGESVEAPRRSAVVDASPTGFLIGLGAGQPRLRPGARLKLLVGFSGGQRRCDGRVVRRFEKDGRSFYGLALENLDEAAAADIGRELYGERAAAIAGLGG
jgi:hypothetical protein